MKMFSQSLVLAVFILASNPVNALVYTPLYCWDSDGGLNISIQGVTGVVLQDNYGAITYATRADQCQDPTHVREYTCGSDNDRDESVVACPSGISCRDGACVSGVTTTTLHQFKCFDTDSGINKNQTGTVAMLQNSGGYTLTADACRRDRPDALNEQYCYSPTENRWDLQYCDGNYCKRGACSGQQIRCVEEDGGYNIYVNGSVTGPHLTNYQDTPWIENTWWDHCYFGPGETVSTGMHYLEEWECKNGFPKKTTGIYCPAGCERDRCNPTTTSTSSTTTTIPCTDSDGGIDPCVKGTARLGPGGSIRTVTDSCGLRNSAVLEAYCGTNIISSSYIGCKYGCRDGACKIGPDGCTTTTTTLQKGSCTDTDGVDGTKFGWVTTPDGRSDDYCPASNRYAVMEYFCMDDGRSSVTQISCRPNSCSSGRCITPMTIPPFCDETDAGDDPCVKGSITGFIEGGNQVWVEISDDCLNSGTVRERYCGDTKAVKYPNSMVKTVMKTCAKGCLNGECVRDDDGSCDAYLTTTTTTTSTTRTTRSTTTTTTTLPRVCTDSDGGINSLQRGTTDGHNLAGNAVSSEDECDASPKKLREFYCSGYLVQVKTIDCADDCVDGACDAATTSTTTTTSRTTTTRATTTTTIPPCTDTDGGLVPETYGEAVGKVKTVADRCANKKTLKEAYCKGGRLPMTKNFICANGCKDGVCMP